MMKTLKAKDLHRPGPLCECSLREIMDWVTIASSHLKPQGENNYDVRNIYDFKLETAWVVKGSGVGETLTFIFTKEEFKKAGKEKINLNGVSILNGYCKNEKTWKNNSRVEKFQIEYNGDPLYEVLLHDSMNIQEVMFDNIWLYPGDTIKLKITGIFPGTKYLDTAITELSLYAAH